MMSLVTRVLVVSLTASLFVSHAVSQEVFRDSVFHTLQVRMGTYRVVLPTVMKPSQTFPAVLVLHGNGHTPEFMMQWIKQLGIDSVIFIFPEAPYPKYGEIIETKKVKLSASGEGIGVPDSLMADVVNASAAWYHDALTDASARLPISKVKPLVLGFSQGGFYSYVVATRYPFTFSGVISVCASMYDYGHALEKFDELRQYGIEVLITHARQDPTVPFQTAELITAALERNGVTHTFLPFDGGHWPTHEISLKIADWIRQHLR
jgi:predicted esterase